MSIYSRRVSEIRELLELTAGLAADFHETLDIRPVYPQATLEELRAAFGGPLPAGATPPHEVVTQLAAAADRGLVAEAGGRYFGFVIGGAVPAALAADWLATAWDQNAGLYVAGPAAAVAEEVAGSWLKELFGLPADASFAFVTGGQMANTTALAAARHHVLAHAGWDVERDGLHGAPRVRVVVGAHRHGTIDRALRLLGLGAPGVVVPADDQGRMIAEGLQLDAAPTIVCAQAGEVNTGAFDPLDAIADACAAAPNAWLHVDGAFGLWAAVSPSLRHFVAGAGRADSWATDAHKWLNVPYDCGVMFCAHPESHAGAMSARAAYLVYGDEERDQMDWNPESSRRARGFAVYAAIRSLGRDGIAALVERCCAHARSFADGLRELGGEVLNDVVLNQVLFRFASDDETDRVLAEVQAGGEAWMGGTTWAGRRAIRISVSNWQTSDEDVERTLAAYRAAVGGHVAAR
jgi:glutamate/tyrosine decarboxylase-like PLP-dependent enzyme